MEMQGNHVYLTQTESAESGYTTPINLDSFDVMAEHNANLRLIHRLQEMHAADDDEITAAERAMIAPSIGRLTARMAITSRLIIEGAHPEAGSEFINDIEKYLGKDYWLE